MRMRFKSFLLLTCTLSVLGFLAVAPAPPAAAAPLAPSVAPIRLPGLQAAARLVQDRNGVTHIEAGTPHDLFFLQGWVHARDRLFQMDVTRRQASGTLAELLGKAALPGDVQARTIGLRRAAERSWAAAPPDLRDALTAYTDGVNEYVASHPLPPEYAALHLTSFQPWTPVDTLTIGKAISFELSFRLLPYKTRPQPIRGQHLPDSELAVVAQKDAVKLQGIATSDLLRGGPIGKYSGA